MQTTHNKNRLEQFSDGVIAIAITLLALELHVPTLMHPDIRGASSEIIALLPTILTFILSFVTIAIFWVNHHQLTHTIGRITRRILWTNVLFLMFVTLIPFVTTAASVNVLHPLAMLTYSFILFGASVSFTVLRYFVHRECGDNEIPMKRSLVGPICYTLAIVSAFFSIWATYLFLAIPALFYFLPKEMTEDEVDVE